MFNRFVITACFLSQLMLAGCAQRSEKVQGTYISPLQYQTYTCEQIELELRRVSARVQEVSGVQDKNARRDAIATGVGIVIFWPALFFLMSGDQKSELSRLKGEYDTLQTVAIQKECSYSADLIAAREREQAERAKAEQEKAARAARQREETLN